MAVEERDIGWFNTSFVPPPGGGGGKIPGGGTRTAEAPPPPPVEAFSLRDAIALSAIGLAAGGAAGYVMKPAVSEVTPTLWSTSRTVYDEPSYDQSVGDIARLVDISRLPQGDPTTRDISDQGPGDIKFLEDYSRQRKVRDRTGFTYEDEPMDQTESQIADLVAQSRGLSVPIPGPVVTPLPKVGPTPAAKPDEDKPEIFSNVESGGSGAGGGSPDRCVALLEAIKTQGLRAIGNLPEDDVCLVQLYQKYGVSSKFALANAVRAGGSNR